MLVGIFGAVIKPLVRTVLDAKHDRCFCSMTKIGESGSGNASGSVSHELVELILHQVRVDSYRPAVVSSRAKPRPRGLVLLRR